MSKLISLCLIALLAQLSLTQIAANPCKDNDAMCVQCVAEKGANICKMCFFQLSDGKACYEKPIANCMIQAKNSDQCEQCNPGYVQTEDFKSCKKFDFPNCAIAGATKKTRSDPFVAGCLTCRPGYYNSRAKNSTDGCIEGPPEDKKIAHCQLYELNMESQFRCKACEKGYSLYRDSCTPECSPGCASCYDDKKCRGCSMFYGYFEEEPGKCVYKGLPDGVNFFGAFTLSSLSFVILASIAALFY